MTAPESPKLEACPRCVGVIHVFNNPNTARAENWHWSCQDCHCGSEWPFDSEEEAAADANRRPAPTASPALPTGQLAEDMEAIMDWLPEFPIGSTECVGDMIRAAQRVCAHVQSQSSTIGGLKADLREAREYLNRLFGGYTDANEQWHCNYCDAELEDDECENPECWAVKARAFLVRTRPAALKPVAPGKETL